MEITLNINDKNVDAFMALIKKLEYVEIKEISNIPIQTAEEPVAAYNKDNKPSADEVEQLIIAKALRDAKAIERGELKGMKSYTNYKDLIADLESEIENDDDIYSNR